MKSGKQAILCMLALVALVGCQTSGEEGVTYSTPTQPEEVSVDGKSDELDGAIRKEEVSESLRSSTLRRMLCDATLAGTTTTLRSLSSDCTGQEFEVTAFYTNMDLIYKGEPTLVAMDVTIRTQESAEVRTRLVRHITSTSLKMSWRGEFIELVSGPDTAVLDAIIDEGDAWPDYGNDDHFTEVDFDELPNTAQIGAEEQASYIEDELAEEYPDEYWVERAHAYKLVDDGGNVVGFAVSYSLSYGNGDGGVTFYFDAEGNFVEERRYYA